MASGQRRTAAEGRRLVFPMFSTCSACSTWRPLLLPNPLPAPGTHSSSLASLPLCCCSHPQISKAWKLDAPGRATHALLCTNSHALSLLPFYRSHPQISKAWKLDAPVESAVVSLPSLESIPDYLRSLSAEAVAAKQVCGGGGGGGGWAVQAGRVGGWVQTG